MMGANLKKPKLALTVAGLLFLWGVVSWFVMPRMEDPEIPDRNAIVTTVYPGANPETVERLVAAPIEDRLAEIDDVKKIKSTIRAEAAIVRIELYGAIEREVAIEQVWDEVRRKLREAQREFPDGVLEPELNTDVLETEAVLLAITGSGDPLALMEGAERLKSALLGVDDVAKVRFAGDPGDQIIIEYDDALARRLGVDPANLAAQLAARNANLPGGAVELGEKTAILRPFAEFVDLEEIRNTPVALPSGAAAPLRELAVVRRGPREPAVERVRYNGARAVAVGVTPRADINVEAFGDKVRAAVESMRPTLAPLEIQEIAFQPERVKNRLADLSGSLAMGVAIVALVLVAFLGARLGLIVAGVVPLIAFSSMGLFHSGGGVLQQISIAALVISLGLLVDNAIVIAEAVQQKLDRGASGLEAATQAIKELATPLLAATGTTLAAFIPMLLAEGDVGSFTRSIPQVIMLTLAVSYLFAVFVTPALAARFQRPKQRRRDPFARISVFLAGFSVERPRATLAVIGALTVLAALGLGGVKKQFFPAGDRNQLLISLELPEGSRLDAADEASRTLEAALRDRPEAVAVAAFVGRGAPQFYYNLPRKPISPHLAQLLVVTRDVGDLEPLSRWTLDFVRQHMPNALAVPRKMEQGPPVDAPVEVRVYSHDWASLQRGVDQAFAAVRGVEGVSIPRHNLGQGIPTVRFSVDDAAAGRRGVARVHAAQTLFGRTRGLPAGQFRYADDPAPILVRSSAGEALPVSALVGLDVAAPGGEPTPLGQVARFEPEWQPAVIHHYQRQRMATISANLAEGYAFSQINAELKPALAKVEWPAGVRFELGGAEEASRTANGAIMAKMPYTGLLLVLILLAEFGSFRRVMIVMATIPLAAAGVIPGLLLANQPFGFMSLLGVLALAGIVVNNAIVLLEAADAKRAEGGTVAEAIHAAVGQRTRPILMTAATTVSGLIPLALSSSSLWPPMAWAMISGLIGSTALTLLATPSLYRLLFQDHQKAV